jgi:group I intron endonuclease
MWYIYKITNTVNGKVYIGQTVNYKNRWSRHRSDAKHKPDSRNKHLTSAIIKYGIDNFTFEVITKADTLEIADDLEIDYIKQYNATDPVFGYNKLPGGQGRRPMSEEMKRKLSESLKGRVSPMKGKHHTDQAKLLLSIANIGNKHSLGVKVSDETKKLLSILNTGKIQSNETRAKRSQSMIGKNAGEKNGMYGKRGARGKLTKEQADNIRLEYKESNISMLKLAYKYNISKRAVFNILHERFYR